MRIERRTDGERWRWCVVDQAGEVLAEFDDNASAWKWIDDHGDQGRADEDRRRRIQSAFAEKC